MLNDLSTFMTKYNKILIVQDSNVEYSLKCDRSKTFRLNISPEKLLKYNVICDEIFEFMIKNKFSRDSLLIALGGGTIGDIVGFVASQYMRGIDFIQIPTTLMSVCDAVYGKVAIDFLNKKNIIGSFYSPVDYLILSDDKISSNPESVFGGWVESFKHYLVSGNLKLYQLFFENENYLFSIKSKLISMFDVNHEIKKFFVDSDPFDKNEIQKALSLGHTFSNYIEKKYNVSHAVGVAIGILFCLKISEVTFKQNYDIYIYKIVDAAIHFDIDLISIIEDLNIDKMLEAIREDKLSNNGEITLILLASIGNHKVAYDLEFDYIRQLCISVKEEIRFYFLQQIIPSIKSYCFTKKIELLQVLAVGSYFKKDSHYDIRYSDIDIVCVINSFSYDVFKKYIRKVSGKFGITFVTQKMINHGIFNIKIYDAIKDNKVIFKNERENVLNWDETVEEPSLFSINLYELIKEYILINTSYPSEKSMHLLKKKSKKILERLLQCRIEETQKQMEEISISGLLEEKL